MLHKEQSILSFSILLIIVGLFLPDESQSQDRPNCLAMIDSQASPGREDRLGFLLIIKLIATFCGFKNY